MKLQIGILVLGLFALVSCSSEEGGSSSSAVVNVVYPPPSSNVGGKTSTIVTGTVSDVENINFLDVNGSLALFDIDTPSRWSANTNVAKGGDINIKVSTGNSDASHKIQNREVVWIPSVEGSAFDAASNKVYLLTTSPSIVSIDVNNGNRRVVTSRQTGAGIQFERGNGIDIDAIKNKVYVVGPYRGVMSVDLNTGNRTLVSSSMQGIGAGPDVLNLRDIAVDSASNKAYVVGDVGGKAAVVVIDLATGDRSVVYYTSIQSLQQIEIDTVNNRVYVIGGSYTALVSVNLDGSGQTFIVDNTTSDDYTIPSYGCCAHFDPEQNRVLISDTADPAIYTIDVVTGMRGVVLEKTLNDSGFSDFLGLNSEKNRLYILDRDFIDVDLTNNIQAIKYDQSTGEGVNLLDAEALDFYDKDTVYLVDRGRDSLMSVDLRTGNRKVISSLIIGSGPKFDSITDLVLSGNNQTAYVLDDGLFALISVDLSNGNRTIISDNNTGVGQFFSFPHDLVLDEKNNRVLVVDNGFGIQSVQAVDLTSGDRTIVSNKDVGSGVDFISPKGIAADYLNNRVYVVDFTLQAILEVDLGTGNRKVLSDKNAGTGPNFAFPTGIAFDEEGNYCLVIDSDLRAVIKVDVSNGDRTIISGTNVIPKFYGANDIVINKEDNVAYVPDRKAIYAVELSSGQRSAISQ